MPSLPHPVKNVKINNFHLCLCLSLLYPLYFLSLPFIRWNIIFRWMIDQLCFASFINRAGFVRAWRDIRFYGIRNNGKYNIFHFTYYSLHNTINIENPWIWKLPFCSTLWGKSYITLTHVMKSFPANAFMNLEL